MTARHGKRKNVVLKHNCWWLNYSHGLKVAELPQWHRKSGGWQPGNGGPRVGKEGWSCREEENEWIWGLVCLNIVLSFHKVDDMKWSWSFILIDGYFWITEGNLNPQISNTKSWWARKHKQLLRLKTWFAFAPLWDMKYCAHFLKL